MTKSLPRLELTENENQNSDFIIFRHPSKGIKQKKSVSSHNRNRDTNRNKKRKTCKRKINKRKTKTKTKRNFFSLF